VALTGANATRRCRRGRRLESYVLVKGDKHKQLANSSARVLVDLCRESTRCKPGTRTYSVGEADGGGDIVDDDAR